MRLKRVIGIKTQRVEIEIDPSRLRVTRIEIHDHNNNVG